MGDARLTIALCLALALSAGPAAAEDPPPPDDSARDAEVFGGGDEGGEEPAPAAPAAPTAPAAGGDARDDSIFGGDAGAGTAEPALTKADLLALERDILQIGGRLYLRFAYAVQEDTDVAADRFSMPSLVDVYLDARPSDRIRGYVRGRLSYDPTFEGAGESALSASFGFAPQDNPDVLLDQLWLKFDIARVVFVTVGKQPAKWGPGHLWNPLDFLHEKHRDPLAFFDERTGISLVKLHLPVESLAWNFYAVALLDGASSLDRIGVAGRAEFVVGPTELALSAKWRKGTAPLVGFDASAGIWDIDFYGEVAISVGTDRPTWAGAFDLATLRFPRRVDHDDEVVPRAVAGFSWGIQVSDDDVMYLGAEYFYNHLGYDDDALYPWLLAGDVVRPLLGEDQAAIAAQLPAPGSFEFFYTGRHYGGLYLLYPNPGSTDSTSLGLSGVANFSDLSFLARFDYQTTVLTWLSIEAFVAGHFGTKGGELRFGIDQPALTLPDGTAVPALRYEPVIVDIGVNLRIAI